MEPDYDEDGNLIRTGSKATANRKKSQNSTVDLSIYNKDHNNSISSKHQ